MLTLLHVLIVEDRQADARLMVAELRQAGFDPKWTRVDTEPDYLEQLNAAPDIILADFSMPQFDALRALHLLRERGQDIPLIVVSGSIGEDRAVSTIKEGAADYLFKDRLARLGPAVKQALAQKQLREANRRAEQALRESLERTTSILDTANDSFIVMDAQGRIIDWNKQAEATFGWSRQEAVGRPLAETIIPEQYRQSHAQGLQEFLGTGEGPILNKRIEIVALRRDGRELDVELMVWPVRVNGACTFSAFLRDITERKRLEEQFRQAQKMEAVGQLAGGVAHDFNNLLTIINGYSEILATSLQEVDPARELVDEISRAGERAASLTRQLLAFSRKQVLAPQMLNLNTIVVDMEKMLRRVIGEDVDLATDLPPNLGSVHADPGQIEQVILNLAINARDAMPQGGKLTIETCNIELDQFYPDVPPGPYVLLAVSDTGHGMTPEVKARIFEPFFTTKEPGKGTGLGLATVFGIIKQSRGHIAVYSEPGAGTAFKIFLPRLGQPARSPQLHAGPQAASGGNETLLLVEDDDGVRALSRHVLQSNGYTVLVATTHGGEALRICAQHKEPIHLLLTDVVIPELGGRELAEQLVRLHPEMKVLFLSGYTDDAVVRHGVLQAETNFLQKPFSPRVLAMKVREVLDASR
jgi:two-component system, cell cycle sensor histidine kinase and response regulator CckA